MKENEETKKIFRERWKISGEKKLGEEIFLLYSVCLQPYNREVYPYIIHHQQSSFYLKFQQERNLQQSYLHNKKALQNLQTRLKKKFYTIFRFEASNAIVEKLIEGNINQTLTHIGQVNINNLLATRT